VISAALQEELADRLIAAYDGVVTLPSLSAAHPDLDVTDAYRVLERVEARRIAQGWQPVGRKIGFTNTTIWARYGVFQPMWARVWQHTVQHARENVATLTLAPFVQPRIEPEVAFGLEGPLPASDDPVEVLEQVAWIAPAFEIVQSHFPDWKFTAADCTAAFGLHGALVVGTPLPLIRENRRTLAAMLRGFELSLSRDGTMVERGVGRNVLGSPALALVHLVRVLAGQPWAPALAAGEVITTGTITDAWPVRRGETWTSDYGDLPLAGLRLAFT
jgi:2-oxo-3-hexenedioate decarboxylase